MSVRPRPAEKAILDRAASSRFVVGGRVIQSYAWGEGPTVLLVHGWNTSAASMTRLVAPLQQAGFRVVALDGPAHGKSGGRQANLKLFGDAVAALIEQTGPVFAVVAHSFGAAATLVALEDRADLQPRLVFAGSQGDPVLSATRMGQALGLKRPALDVMEQRLAKAVGRPLEGFQATKTARLRAAPALVIHDVGDVLVPWQEGKAVATALAGSQFLKTEGLGHNRWLRDGQVVDKVLDFLRDTKAAAA